MVLRPKKMSEKFKMSASTIRNYEAKGLIPPADRSANGYRIYTEQHETYLACIQAMAPAFGMEMTTEVLHCLQRGELDKALWIVKEREVSLYREKARVEKLIKELEVYADGSQAHDLTKRFNINETSLRTGVPKSAIRYWEKVSLITAERDPANDYRQYSEAHLFKIRLIQALQSSVYSKDTVSLKKSIASIDDHNIEHVMKLAEKILIYLNNTNKSQMRGLYYLYKLIRLTDTNR
ncbi:MerR family DNA-binding transcriptional regulator [Risungbinella massiliensis]|uniref:MerR family DNA-binding transcriptional regulator n=1 Tax=Risungbinella massiliensis TaxID=1329796 RepID=UPI0005CC59D6|nr:MerR family transcriptional regulator [Risungbinella massiliensis]